MIVQELFRASRAPLLRYAQRITKSREDAEDAVQEVFLKLLDGRLRKAEWKALWLPLRNQSLDLLRKQKRFLPLLLNEEGEPFQEVLDPFSPERILFAKETLENLRLAPSERGLLERSFEGGLSGPERIALFRLRKRLRGLKRWRTTTGDRFI